jgi:hypothetical protein
MERKLETNTGEEKTLLELFVNILKENDTFCKSNPDAREADTELQNLMNESMIYNAWDKFIPWSEFGKATAESAMITYLAFILRPLAFGIYLDFLGGNLVAVFMQLRTLLEQLAKCNHADSLRNTHHESFFQTRLEAVEQLPQSMTKTIGTLGTDAEELWRRLSNRWVHMKRMEGLVNAVSERGIPGYAIIIPVNYDDHDIPDIKDLTETVRQFRKLLALTLDRWNPSKRNNLGRFLGGG